MSRDVEILVRCDCPTCDWYGAFPEGGKPPVCPTCLEEVWPPAAEPGNPGERRAYAAELLADGTDVIVRTLELRCAA